MMTTIRRLAMAAAVCLAAAGCVTDPNEVATSSTTPDATPYEQPDVSTLTYRAVDLMLAAAPDVTSSTPLVVASLSDARNLEKSSALGNIVADMIRTRLAQTGHKISEVRLRSAMSLRRGAGEFLLSRNRGALMSAPSAAAVVTGTYAVSYEKVYVSIKMISADDGRIIAGADFVVPLGDVLGLIDEHGS
jgi:TolB-like protein